MAKYQCTQLSVCPRADACEEIEIKPGVSFQCGRNPPDPKCREQLLEIRGRRLSPKLRILLIAILFSVLLGSGAWMMMGFSKTADQRKSEANAEQLLIDVWPWLKSAQ
jgi:hypothetical protein